MKLLTIVLLCFTVATHAFAESDGKAAIAAAAEKYVTANSAIQKVQVTVEKVEGNYARAKAAPPRVGHGRRPCPTPHRPAPRARPRARSAA